MSRRTDAVRKCQEVNGILPLDKPLGLTSNGALQEAKRLLMACKAGHTGSLDPIASGLLLLCFGEATKISRFLLEADKRYEAVFKLGETTTTYDSEGEVTQRRAVNVTRAAIEAALARFVGEFEQMPPVYSAIKRAGRPLYEYARAGEAVEVQPRKVRVYESRLLAFDGALATVAIHCGKGTYVRSLAHDVGELLGCGGHVIGLKRTLLGPYRLEQAVTLDTLRQMPDPLARHPCLLPVDTALQGFPEVELSANAAYYLCHGQSVFLAGKTPPGWVRVYGQDRSFLGLGEIGEDGRLAPRRLMHTA